LKRLRQASSPPTPTGAAGRPQWRWYETFGNKIGSPSGLSDSLRHGLDQMNVELPFFDLAGLGEVELELVVDGQVANRVWVWIK